MSRNCKALRAVSGAGTMGRGRRWDRSAEKVQRDIPTSVHTAEVPSITLTETNEKLCEVTAYRQMIC